MSASAQRSRCTPKTYLFSGSKLPLVLLLLGLQQPLAPLLDGLDLLAQPVVAVQLHRQAVFVLILQFLGYL